MIKQVTLNPPAINQTGDEFRRDGNYLNQWRNGIVIQTWNLLAMESQRLDTAVVNGSVVSTLYLEQSMAGVNESLVGVSTRENGSVLFTFGSGSQSEYPNWESLGDEADSIDAGLALAQKLLLTKAFRNDTAGVNKANFVGGQVSINLAADQPVTFVEPS